MIRKEIAEISVKKHLTSLEPDGLSRFTLLDNSIRGAIVSATALCTQMRVNHGLGIIESLALSQASMGALLYTINLKEGDRVDMRVDCTGSLRGWSVQADAEGRLRGHLFNPSVQLDRPLESLDLQAFIGSGTLAVRRYHGDRESWNGLVELAKGRIAEDLAAYYLKSEQIKTSISLSVRYNSEGHIVAAAGILLQALPGAREIDLEDAEDRLKELGSVSDWIIPGNKRAELISSWFGAFGPKFLQSKPVSFYCPCSQERMYSYLQLLSEHEKAEILEQGPFPLELICHSCSSLYQFDKEDIKNLVN